MRSTRLLERRSKKRKKPKSKVQDEESYLTKKSDVQGRLLVEKKISERFDQNDPLRLFLWGPETKQLLTLEEESQLIVQLQVSLLIPLSLTCMECWIKDLQLP